MPVLAHLDDPPRSRTRGLLVGFAIAVPLALTFMFWVIPPFVDAIMGGARDLDDRLRAEDGYMKALCADAFESPRDDALCGCVLGTEYPSLDCQFAFKHWTLARQGEFCSDAEQRQRSLSFCSCVDAVAGKVAAAPPEQQDTEVVAYERCMQLPDAAFLPTIEALAGG
jgi:hypothetical protein